MEVVLTVDAADLPGEFDAIVRLSPEARVVPLARLARRLAEAGADGAALPKARVTATMIALIEDGAGSAHERLELGEALGVLGDPRLRLPSQPDYWVAVPAEDGAVHVGRYPVTNHEFRRWVDAGGYQDRAAWSEEGWAWLQSVTDPWPERSRASDAAPFIVPNQPVVAVSWYEAEAYATATKARLPRLDERISVVRGIAKRPYPWGSPFGEGKANTREEVLARPCAVGLYRDDHIPEGVYDLAGNVAEWAQDGVGDQRWYAPGAWDQPSMASWAKARELEKPSSRWTGIGFRLFRD